MFKDLDRHFTWILFLSFETQKFIYLFIISFIENTSLRFFFFQLYGELGHSAPLIIF